MQNKSYIELSEMILPNMYSIFLQQTGVFIKQTVFTQDVYNLNESHIMNHINITKPIYISLNYM